MEECEALCTRLAIMTEGQLRCVGETTTLKSIFGINYSVVLKTSVKATEEDRLKLKTAMVNTFGPDCLLLDQHLVGLKENLIFIRDPNVEDRQILFRFKSIIIFVFLLFRQFLHSKYQKNRSHGKNYFRN